VAEPDRIIQTARLRGAPLQLDDFDSLRLLEADSDVQKTISGIVRTADETRERLERFVVSWERDGFGAWAFSLAGTEFVGTCGLYAGRLPDFDGLEIGYMLRPLFWGRGLATEMALAVMRFAFVALQTPAVGAMLLPDNAASMRVLEKCGLRRGSDFLYLGSPAASFAVSREEWMRANAQ
jgi:RimJ/RimL family protein N-acetyltransferase